MARGDNILFTALAAAATGDDGEGGGGGDGECGGSGDGQRTNDGGATTATSRRGSSGRGSGAAMAATTLGTTVAAQWACAGGRGLWAWAGMWYGCGARRTARSAMATMTSHTQNMAPDVLENQLKSHLYALFFPSGGACGGRLGAAPGKKLREVYGQHS